MGYWLETEMGNVFNSGWQEERHFRIYKLRKNSLTHSPSAKHFQRKQTQKVFKKKANAKSFQRKANAKSFQRKVNAKSFQKKSKRKEFSKKTNATTEKCHKGIVKMN